jgi:hypothetical protein
MVLAHIQNIPAHYQFVHTFAHEVKALIHAFLTVSCNPRPLVRPPWLLKSEWVISLQIFFACLYFLSRLIRDRYTYLDMLRGR